MRQVIAAIALGVSAAYGQAAPDPVAALRAQVEELRQALREVQTDLVTTRRELQALREQVPSSVPAQASAAVLAEQQQVLEAKLADQNQSKVESGSRYRVRLSGIALMNVFHTRGQADSIDVPGIAQPRAAGESGGSFGASARQSMFRLEVSGPSIGGARTSGEASLDFFGGFPSSREGLTSGLVRLRTAKLTLDWNSTSLVAGQDAPFFSPRSPTSLAAEAYPAFSSAGNMWTWTPQVHVEQRMPVNERTTFVAQFGVLDPLTGELPGSEYERKATAGERSRTPAYAGRLALRSGSLEMGTGGYYSRQDWGFGRTVDGWAATADWDVPLGRWFSLSGELYRGRAIGGLGASAAESVLFRGSPTLGSSAVVPVNSAGGWTQLKFKPIPRVEFNTAFGVDDPFGVLKGRPLFDSAANDPAYGRNASAFANVIYQMRSAFLVSLEYRRLWTTRFNGGRSTADHINLGAGVIF